MRDFVLILLFLLGTAGSSSQELNCQVEINADQVESTSRELFKTLEQSIADYMNTTSFSDARFSQVEKIDCRLFFVVKEYANDQISGELQVQSSRPVYNSSYQTTILNFKDNNVTFDYREYDPLIFSTMTMESQLTAILNFYAYLILAMDFDTFSPRGGEEYYSKAQQVVQMAQSSGESGWRMFEDNRNRSAVLMALTDQSTSGLRDLLYDYHRKGLDEMTIAPDKARARITELLTTALPEIYSKAPMSVGPVLFRDAKLDEIVSLYSKGSETEKKKIISVLSDIFPTDQNRLQTISQK